MLMAVVHVDLRNTCRHSLTLKFAAQTIDSIHLIRFIYRKLRVRKHSHGTAVMAHAKPTCSNAVVPTAFDCFDDERRHEQVSKQHYVAPTVRYGWHRYRNMNKLEYFRFIPFYLLRLKNL